MKNAILRPIEGMQVDETALTPESVQVVENVAFSGWVVRSWESC